MAGLGLDWFLVVSPIFRIVVAASLELVLRVTSVFDSGKNGEDFFWWTLWANMAFLSVLGCSSGSLTDRLID